MLEVKGSAWLYLLLLLYCDPLLFIISLYCILGVLFGCTFMIGDHIILFHHGRRGGGVRLMVGLRADLCTRGGGRTRRLIRRGQAKQ